LVAFFIVNLALICGVKKSRRFFLPRLSVSPACKVIRNKPLLQEFENKKEILNIKEG